MARIADRWQEVLSEQLMLISGEAETKSHGVTVSNGRCRVSSGSNKHENIRSDQSVWGTREQQRRVCRAAPCGAQVEVSYLSIRLFRLLSILDELTLVDVRMQDTTKNRGADITAGSIVQDLASVCLQIT